MLTDKATGDEKFDKKENSCYSTRNEQGQSIREQRCCISPESDQRWQWEQK
jgi:hypothetical protein